MIKISALSETVLQQHAAAMRERFNQRKAINTSFKRGKPRAAVKAHSWIPDLLAYLESQIDVILRGEPHLLTGVVTHIKSTFATFHTYCCEQPKAGTPEHDPNLLIGRLGKLFDYSAFSNRKAGWNAYSLVDAYSLRLCPYCQLAHVDYHLRGGEDKFSMRPPLDHFYPKSRYPYLAVSAYNLIPSCWLCNSSVKSSDDPLDHNLPHPCDKNASLSIKFSIDGYTRLTPIADAHEIKIVVKGKKKADKAFISFFRLEKRYGWYNHEVMDLYRRHQTYEDVDEVLKDIVERQEFVLGFSPVEAQKRLLGLCLQSVAREL
jgi:hypothetical protein